MQSKQSAQKRQPRTPPRGLSLLRAARLLVRLANLGRHETAQFRREWKVYERYRDEELLRLRDELRLLWGYGSIYAVDLNKEDSPPLASHHSKHADQLLDICNHTNEPVEQVVCQSWLRRDRWALEAQWTAERKGFRVSPLSLPGTLACSAMRYADYLKVCQNFEREKYRKGGHEELRPVCGSRTGTSRYFIARRLDQKFCSTCCADFIRAKTKREWWEQNKPRLNRRRRGSAARTLPSNKRTTLGEVPLTG